MKKPKKVKTAFSEYLIQTKIGEGGNGVVFKANDDDGNEYAIKILDIKKASREKIKRFKNEHNFSVRNKHPNIITVSDSGLTGNGEPFFVMPLFESSLRGVIGKLQPKQAYEIIVKIMNGVEAAHKLNVIHRDLKPENILVKDEGRKLVIADFGIASFREEDLLTSVDTKPGAKMGNFQYAAPEQREKVKGVDHRADIFALGLIMNELFTSKLAHGQGYKTIEAVSPEYSYIDPVIARMLQQNPDSRHQSIEEIKNDFNGRSQEYISKQKLNRLKDTVIPEAELDDPIINDPMRVVDAKWDGRALHIELNHSTNPDWLWALNNMGGHTSLYGIGPEMFNFHKNRASVSSDSRQAPIIINHFKDWLIQTSRVYKNKMIRDKEEARRKEKKELERLIRLEEEKAKVNKELKF